ncbi:hypothetical protein PSTG_12083 [Puccinia striiformis f. sp. tritici PST-78]|uniref:Uncharacterized protein n=2 Tax=Puccinia striiformis TaxID=27350 RepID=A0A0L0V5I7_9BASI|nr:hypothetical protein PSTG_12083 [Puccinia striiformis f. sp. tritici PST-78]
MALQIFGRGLYFHPVLELDTVEITVRVNPRSATPGPIVNMAGVAYSSAVENTIAKGFSIASRIVRSEIQQPIETSSLAWPASHD